MTAREWVLPGALIVVSVVLFVVSWLLRSEVRHG